jgi:predicted negative regulator of RcsB-dependent stress response
VGLIRSLQKTLPEEAALVEDGEKLKRAPIYHARSGDIYAAAGRRSEAQAAWRRATASLSGLTENPEITLGKLRRRLRR